MADANEKKVMVDAKEKIEVLKYEVENLKIALEAANNALKVERQDRKTYEAMVNDAKTRDSQVYEERVQNIKDHINIFFTKLNDEHEVKLKLLEEDYDKNLLKLQLLPSPPIICDQSQQTFPPGLTNRSQQTAPENFSDNSVQTLTIPLLNLSVQTEFNDDSYLTALKLQVKIVQLKKEVSELVIENNRYHLAISNCIFCASDDPDDSDASSTFPDELMRASTPLSLTVPSLVPALM